jgi:hypothetical protein
VTERVRTDVALETHLAKVAGTQGQDFPVPSFNYFEKYCEIKRFLAANYYEVAGAGLALEGERFTKHSIDHVDDVIRQAGHLARIMQHRLADVV